MRAMAEEDRQPAGGVESDAAQAPITSREVERAIDGASSIADGVVRPLDPRYVAFQKLVAWIVTACVSLPILGSCLVMAFVPGVPAWVKLLAFPGWAVVSGGIAWVGQVWPAIEHRHASYRVDRQGIEIRTGVVWRKIVSVARSRVQHTDVARGPLERYWGLATLHIYTAGTEHSQVDLHGLDHGTALEIRDHLLAGGRDDAV